MHAKPILAAILIGTAGAACGGVGRAADWKALPQDVHAAVHLDMRALASSDLYRALLERHPDGLAGAAGEYRALSEAMGFDMTEDLDTLTLGAGGDPNDPDSPFYAILTGRFDHAKIEAWAHASGEVTTGTFEGLRTYSPAVDVNSGPPPTAAFTDEHTLILASAGDLPRLVAALRGTGPTTRDSPLAALLASAEGQVRVAVEIPESIKTEPAAAAEASPAGGALALLSQLQNPAAGPMHNLESIVLALDARTGLDLAIQAAADSPASGKLVHDTLAGYLMLGRALSLRNPELASLLDRLRLEQVGSTVRISLSMSSEEVAAALNQATATRDGG